MEASGGSAGIQTSNDPGRERSLCCTALQHSGAHEGPGTSNDAQSPRCQCSDSGRRYSVVDGSGGVKSFRPKTVAPSGRHPAGRPRMKNVFSASSTACRKNGCTSGASPILASVATAVSSTAMRASSGFNPSADKSFSMGSPLVKLKCLSAFSVARRVARPFSPTHRHQVRRICPGGLLPVTRCTRRQAHATGCAGAVGAFYSGHGRSVAAALAPVCHNKI